MLEILKTDWYGNCFEGTLSVILSDPQCKGGNGRITTIPLWFICSVLSFSGFSSRSFSIGFPAVEMRKSLV